MEGKTTKEEIINNKLTLEKDVESYRQKMKELELQKINEIHAKNREIEIYKNKAGETDKDLQNMKVQVKKKDDEILYKEQALKKMELNLTNMDRKYKNCIKEINSEIQELRDKLTLLKSQKEAMKNAHWEVERESKKVTQKFIQAVVTACPQEKEKLLVPIRNLQTALATVIKFKF